MNKLINEYLAQKGADIVRFADISQLPENQTQGYKKAIVFCLALSKKFILDMHNNLPFDANGRLPEKADEFLQKEQKADEISEQLAGFIQEKGYNAYAQSERNNSKSGNYDEKTFTSVLPHKTIARIAGLGFIGKSNLLITSEYGSAISMCTILTDAPIETLNYQIIPPKCGNCDLCVKACPAGAIHGTEWTQSGGRDSLVDVSKCCCELKCMTSCPWTLRYAQR